MIGRKDTGSVVCPSCGRLVGVRDEKCFNCGRIAPGLWGYAPMIQSVTRGANFLDIVFVGCVLMFVISIALRPAAALQGGGFFSMLSPGGEQLYLLGMSGAVPVFRDGRWWTVLSAAWLHGGLLHIAFNLYWLRQMGGAVVNVLGPGRTVIIYTGGAIIGFFGTSVMALFLQIPFLSGAFYSVGASASLCGLVGGLYAYGQKQRQPWIKSNAMRFAVSILIFGLLIPMVDNWAHIFGFLGGYIAALLVRPLEDESPAHLAVALVCLLAFALSIIASVLHGLPMYR